ncbi:MAG: hypothetical protein ACRC7O_06240 [Fimbriiglobus sp.]
MPRPTPNPPAPAYRLAGPKNRRYVFTPLPDGRVRVRRVEVPAVVFDEVMPVEKARSRWAWLKKLGYK